MSVGLIVILYRQLDTGSSTIPQPIREGTALQWLDIPIGILLELRAHCRAEFVLQHRMCTRLSGYDMPPSQDPFYAGLGQAVRIGTELLAALIVGGGLGWVVDTYLLDSTPWGLVAGLMFGAAAGVRNAYRSAQRWQNSSDNSPRQR